MIRYEFSREAKGTFEAVCGFPSPVLVVEANTRGWKEFLKKIDKVFAEEKHNTIIFDSFSEIKPLETP